MVLPLLLHEVPQRNNTVWFPFFTEDSSKKHPFPCPTTYRTALSCYLDITSNPRTHIFKELAEYATDESEKEVLKLLGGSTPEGKDKYNKWIIGDNRNIVHVLQDLPSCKPKLDHLCELLPRLQCRYYSIASSPKVFYCRQLNFAIQMNHVSRNADFSIFLYEAKFFLVLSCRYIRTAFISPQRWLNMRPQQDEQTKEYALAGYLIASRHLFLMEFPMMTVKIMLQR